MFFSITLPVLACTQPPNPPTYTLEDYVNNAQFVIVGTVSSGFFDDNGAVNRSSIIVRADITVEHYLKGTGPTRVFIDGFGDSALCRSPIMLGQRYIFFANGDTAAIMQAAYLGSNDAVRLASEENIAAVFAITNQSLPPDSVDKITPSPTETSTVTPTLTPTASSTMMLINTATATNTATPTATPTLKSSNTPNLTEEVEAIATSKTSTPEPAIPAMETDNNRQVLFIFSIVMVALSSMGLIALFIYGRRR